MIQNDDDLKRLYREHVRGRAPAGRDVCPDPEILAKIATPGAHVGNRKELLDHIGGCPECSSELRLILDIHNESGALSRRLVPDRKNRLLRGTRALQLIPSPRLFKLAFAVFGVAMTFISIFLLVQRQEPRIDLRSTKPSIGLLSPLGGHRSSAPLLFEWKRLPGAEYYILELYDDELLPVWSSPSLADSRLVLPEDVARRLSTDKPTYWMVTAFSRKEKVSASDLAHFVLHSK